MADEEMVIIVTGANRGIGKAICERILKTQPKAYLFAASRAGKDIGFVTNPGQTVVYEKLDISSPESIKAFSQKLGDRAPSVLINNSGINLLPKHTNETVKTMLDTNFRGTRDMCLAILPIMKPGGRIVSLSSTGSSLGIYSRAVADRFRSIKSLEEAEAMASEYQMIVANGQEKESGFGKEGDGYPVSKALINAITRVLADSPEAKEKGILINACCPGWVNTSMGNIVGNGGKTPEDGATIPVRLAFDKSINVSGKYWANDSVMSRDDGKVQEQ